MLDSKSRDVQADFIRVVAMLIAIHIPLKNSKKRVISYFAE